MPDQKDHDIPKKDPQDMNIDPYWDALMSNPELRNAYNEAERNGYSGKRAHAIARIEVFGVDHARESFSHNNDEEVFQEVLDERYHEQTQSDDSKENQEEDVVNPSLDKWGDDTQCTQTGHWEEFREHLDRIPAVKSYSLSKESGTAKVNVEDKRGQVSVGRELFTRVAHMGFIVGEIHGDRNEIKFIDILGEHYHYMPDELSLSSGEKGDD